MSLLKTATIILAAGSSSRLGQPKQLLSFQHKTLLSNTIDAAKLAADGIVVVILGGQYQQIKESIADKKVDIVINPDWEEGMGSSIRIGLAALLQKYGNLESVMLTVCDQPFIDAAVLNALFNQASVLPQSIIASTYADTIGVPALFKKAHFQELLALKGQEGAKKLLVNYKDDVATIPFPKGASDIDTPEDYQRLIASNPPKQT